MRLMAKKLLGKYRYPPEDIPEALEGLPTDKRERLVNSSAERDPQPSRPKPS